MSEKDDAVKVPKVKDVQRGVWSPETVAEIKHKAEMAKHRIR